MLWHSWGPHHRLIWKLCKYLALAKVLVTGISFLWIFLYCVCRQSFMWTQWCLIFVHFLWLLLCYNRNTELEVLTVWLYSTACGPLVTCILTISYVIKTLLWYGFFSPLYCYILLYTCLFIALYLILKNNYETYTSGWWNVFLKCQFYRLHRKVLSHGFSEDTLWCYD